MGKRFAPSYANIFMADLEHEISKLDIPQPEYNFRFLDDIFLIWLHSEEEFSIFLNALNSFYDSIKFTAKINPKSIDFLDTTIYKGTHFSETSRLDIKVYLNQRIRMNCCIKI
ncbi:hypothetical protein JQN64_28030, partial [Escherichia coli]|nr:hypothetical protein [Escherichia coli]